MAIATIIWLVVGFIIIIALGVSVKGWISIYNKFQYWITRAQRKFADVDVVIQERLDNIHALAQIAKKYDIHEYKALKDVIEARSRWTKDAELNEKVKPKFSKDARAKSDVPASSNEDASGDAQSTDK